MAQGAILIAASLEENSPFIPFDYETAPPPVAGPQKGGVELRGVLDYDGETRFSIYNPTNQKSVWIKLNDEKAPYLIDSYDPVKNLITITVNGLRQQLPMSKSSDAVLAGGARPPVRTPILSANTPTSPRFSREPEPLQDEEEDEEEEDSSEDMPEDPDVQRRKEMSEKVYEAFKKYVSEKRGQS